MKKVKAFLTKNIFLTVFLSLMFGVLFAIAWIWGMYLAVDGVKPGYEKYVPYVAPVYRVKEIEKRFEYTDSGVFYHSQSGIEAGPFQYLYENDFNTSSDGIARYVGENGKFGYLKEDGSFLTDPIFTEAAEFWNGTARVQEKQGIYYIDTEANRITKDYQDGSPAFEYQGSYCRVQADDGTWGIINREDEKIFSGADTIEELPLVTRLGSAVVDGKAVLFQLGLDEDGEEFQIVASYDSYVKISEVRNGCVAFVWTEDGRMGAVDYTGKVIVPAEYQKVELKYMEEDYTLNRLIFLAYDDTGKVQVINVTP